jgi:hypothetical protein
MPLTVAFNAKDCVRITHKFARSCERHDKVGVSLVPYMNNEAFDAWIKANGGVPYIDEDADISERMEKHKTLKHVRPSRQQNDNSIMASTRMANVYNRLNRGANHVSAKKSYVFAMRADGSSWDSADWQGLQGICAGILNERGLLSQVNRAGGLAVQAGHGGEGVQGSRCAGAAAARRVPGLRGQRRR